MAGIHHSRCCCGGTDCYEPSPSCAYVLSSPGTPTNVRPYWTVATPWDPRLEWTEATPGSGIRYLNLAGGGSIETGDGSAIVLIPVMWITPLTNAIGSPCKWTTTFFSALGLATERAGSGGTGASVRSYRSLNFEFERTSASTAVVRCFLWDTGHAVKLWIFHNTVATTDNPRAVVVVDDHASAVAGQLDPLDGSNCRLSNTQGTVQIRPCENLSPATHCGAAGKPASVTWGDALAIAQEADAAATTTGPLGMAPNACPTASPHYVAANSITLNSYPIPNDYALACFFSNNRWPQGWDLTLGAAPDPYEPTGPGEPTIWWGRSTAPNRWPDGTFYRVSHFGSFATTTVDDGLP